MVEEEPWKSESGGFYREERQMLSASLISTYLSEGFLGNLKRRMEDPLE